MGNCVPGTHAFMRRAGIPTSKPFAGLDQVAGFSNEYRAMSAIRHAAGQLMRQMRLAEAA